MLIELSILLRIYWCPIMTIVSIETAIVMKYSFIIKTNILKKICSSAPNVYLLN